MGGGGGGGVNMVEQVKEKRLRLKRKGNDLKQDTVDVVTSPLCIRCITLQSAIHKMSQLYSQLCVRRVTYFAIFQGPVSDG